MSHGEGDLVLVEWNDASGLGVWQDENDAYVDAGYDVCKCITVGWIMRLTEEALTVYASKSKKQMSGMVSNSVSDQTKIPQECITRIRLLSKECDDE